MDFHVSSTLFLEEDTLDPSKVDGKDFPKLFKTRSLVSSSIKRQHDLTIVTPTVSSLSLRSPL